MPAELLLLMREGCRIFETEQLQFGVATPRREREVKGLTTGVRIALLRLNDGIAEEELVSSTMQTDGSASLPLLFFALDQLGRLGALSYRASGDDGPLATASSSAPFTFRRRAGDDETRHRFSRFALMRRVGERMVIETARSAVRIVIDDLRAVAFIAAMSVPSRFGDCATSSGLSAGEAAALGSLLLSCGVFADEDEENGALAWWDFHDLLFHARSRVGRHLGSYGGTYPFRDRFEPLPSRKPAMSGDALDLYRPDLERLRTADIPFTSVLEGRRSVRTFGNPPIHLQQLGEFLYRAARERGMDQAGRPYPGGGAIYELEIYLSVGSCVDLPVGLYHYSPREHRLSRLMTRPELIKAMFRDATQPGFDSPQVLLTMAARFGRIFWKYESMGYALILKDVGALFQTMYLVAEAMGLGACAIGGGDSDLFATATGLDYYAETSVGELVIGSRTDGDQRGSAPWET